MSNAATKPTKEQVDAHLQVIKAIADTIRELKQVPNGHLYARVMEYMELSAYQTIISILKDCKLIEEKNHVLVWIGP